VEGQNVAPRLEFPAFGQPDAFASGADIPHERLHVVKHHRLEHLVGELKWAGERECGADPGRLQLRLESLLVILGVSREVGHWIRVPSVCRFSLVRPSARVLASVVHEAG